MFIICEIVISYISITSDLSVCINKNYTISITEKQSAFRLFRLSRPSRPGAVFLRAEEPPSPLEPDVKLLEVAWGQLGQRDMAQCQEVTERLKASDQIAWVGRMNNIQASATEIVNCELIYV